MTIKRYTVIGIDYEEADTLMLVVDATSPEDAIDHAIKKYCLDNDLPEEGDIEMQYVFEGDLSNLCPERD